MKLRHQNSKENVATTLSELKELEHYIKAEKTFMFNLENSITKKSPMGQLRKLIREYRNVKKLKNNLTKAQLKVINNITEEINQGINKIDAISQSSEDKPPKDDSKKE